MDLECEADCGCQSLYQKQSALITRSSVVEAGKNGRYMKQWALNILWLTWLTVVVHVFFVHDGTKFWYMSDHRGSSSVNCGA
jgi:hypothetical protein